MPMTLFSLSSTPAREESAATDFFKLFFGALDRRGIPYAVLHAYEELPALVSSDVDFAVRACDLAAVRPILIQTAGELGWVHAKTIRHEVCGFQFVAIDPHNVRQFLQLDVCPHFMRDAHFFLSDEELLEGRRMHNGFYIPSPPSEFAYILAKTLAKKKRLSDCLPRLRELWEQEPERCAKLLAQLLGEAFSSFDKLEQAVGNAGALARSMRARHPRKAKMQMLEWGRIFQRMLKPCGLHLAVLGPDGVGKSTLLQHLGVLKLSLFRSLKLWHFRPGFFEGKAQNPSVEQPHGRAARGTLASWLKVLYYALDHWCGYLFEQLPGLMKNDCVIFDRNFDDLLIDPVRYRIRNSRWLVLLLRRLLPRPDLTLILDARPEVVHQRKPELSMEEIARQRAVMQSLAKAGKCYKMISAEQTAEKVAAEVCHSIAVFLAARERNR